MSKPSATIPPGEPRLVPESPEELLDGLDLTPPAVALEPPPSMEPAVAASARPARSTLVAEPDEAEDLRRRITRPISESDYEVNLEEVAPPEPMEEITLDSEPLPTFEPEAEPEALETESSISPLSLDEVQEVEDLPPPIPAPSWQAPAVRSVGPEPLVIEVEAGRTEVTVPMEVSIEPGVDQVSVNLRLVFKIRR